MDWKLLLKQKEWTFTPTVVFKKRLTPEIIILFWDIETAQPLPTRYLHLIKDRSGFNSIEDSWTKVFRDYADKLSRVTEIIWQFFWKHTNNYVFDEINMNPLWLPGIALTIFLRMCNRTLKKSPWSADWLRNFVSFFLYFYLFISKHTAIKSF